MPPALTAALSAPCPPLALISDNTIAALAQADVDAAVSYAECQARHSAVVKAYASARAAIIKAIGTLPK